MKACGRDAAMSRPDTCTAQPTTDQDDRGDTYKRRTRSPVYSAMVSKRPRRHLSVRSRTRGSDGNPRRVWAASVIEGDTHLLGEVPVGSFDTAGDHVTFLMSQRAAGSR